MSYARWLAEVAADSPTSWWKLNETSGTNAADAGSAGNDGTYENGVVLAQPGWVSGGSNVAAQFDGTDDDVLTDASIFGTPASVSFECIIKPSAFPADGFAFLVTDSYQDGGDSVVGVYDGWNLTIAPSGAVLEVTQFGGGGANVELVGATPIALGVWQHIGFIWTDDGTDQHGTLLVGGCVDAQADYTGMSIIYDANRNLLLGKQNKANRQAFRYFAGLYDEAVLWDSAIDVLRMKAHANAAGFFCARGGWGVGNRFGGSGWSVS